MPWQLFLEVLVWGYNKKLTVLKMTVLKNFIKFIPLNFAKSVKDLCRVCLAWKVDLEQIFTLFSLRWDGFRPHSPPLKLFYITQKLVNLVRQNFVTFPKIYLATFIQNHFELVCISESLRGQRSAPGIFKKLKALDISLVVYWKVFF